MLFRAGLGVELCDNGNACGSANEPLRVRLCHSDIMMAVVKLDDDSSDNGARQCRIPGMRTLLYIASIALHSVLYSTYYHTSSST